MSPSARHDCDLLLERRAAGTLAVGDAALLASHAAGCERCASALHRVRQSDEGFGRPVGAPRPMGATGSALRARRPLAIGAAAVAVTVIAGTAIWKTETRVHAREVVMRGRGGNLPLVAVQQADGTLRLTWPRTPKAVKYDVVLTGSANGDVARSVTQPALALQPSEIAAVGDVEVTVESTTASGEHASRSTRLRLAPTPISPSP